MTATTTEQMPCTSCKRPKRELKRKNSKLLTGVPMYLCQSCLDGKMEPRGFVVLAAREHGLEYVSNWIKPQRYIGEPITLREVD